VVAEQIGLLATPTEETVPMLRIAAVAGSALIAAVAIAVPTTGLADDLALPTPTPAPKAAPAAPTKQQIIERTKGGVVRIFSREGESEGSGTGFVLDAAKGLIATNAHVVEGAASISVTLPDGTQIPGRTIAAAPCEDLAVVQIAPRPGLVALPFGATAAPKVGDQALAFGFPESLEANGGETLKVTGGMISATDVRSAPSLSLPEYPSTIQHQAAVNHGNSGGPLVDDHGRVIGINTLTNAGGESGQVEGQYYAISSAHAQGVLAELSAGRSQADAGMKLTSLHDVDFESMEGGPELLADLEARGMQDALYVESVRSGSAAAKADIRPGDLLHSLEGTAVGSVADVCGTLSSHRPGEELRADLVALDSEGTEYLEPATTKLVVPR